MTFGVLPEYRRRGIATRLLSETRDRIQLRWASKFNLCRRITLHCQASNKGAVAFYEHNGFRVDEFLPYYYSFDENTQSEERRRMFDWTPHANLMSAPVDPFSPEPSFFDDIFCGICSGLFQRSPNHDIDELRNSLHQEEP